eukprot:8671210-Alexandrium_andersonii.AAC.1
MTFLVFSGPSVARLSVRSWSVSEISFMMTSVASPARTSWIPSRLALLGAALHLLDAAVLSASGGN